MYLSLLFWLALALPGYTIVRRYWPDDLKSGLLGVFAISYLASFAILSPVSILCYVLRAPLAVFSIACVLAVVAAVVDLTRQRGWRPLGTLFLAALGVELAIVVLDMAIGARTGAFFGGDAKVHLARIRFLLDHGFSNDDPSVAVRYFFPIYHTNLLHALFAACCQITRQDHIGVWFVSLTWAKLLVASGCYYLAWCVFDRHWPAWIAAMVCIGHRGPINFLIYPNQLSPYWLVPLALAFTLQACRSSVDGRSATKLAAVSLVLGQMHGLYVFFTIVLAGPLLAGGAIVALVQRRRSIALRRAVCLAALAVGMPFLLVSKAGNVLAEAPVSGPTQVDEELAAHFISLESDGMMRKPSSALELFGAGLWGTLAMTACILAALADRRRTEALKLLVAPAVVAVLLYTPFFCTMLLRHALEAWVILRMEFIYQIIFIVLGAASLAAFIEPKVRFRWARSLIAIAAVAAALPFTDYGKTWTWPKQLARARQSSDERLANVRKCRELAGFLRENLPPGSTVLTSLPSGVDLIMLADCHVVAPGNAGNGIPDWLPRRRDHYLLLHKDTPWKKRLDLLRQYNVRYFFPTKPPVDWARGHVRRSWKFDNYLLCEMAIDEHDGP